MNGERTYLPVGTTVKLDGGSVYRIIGKSVGCGGGSIIYPAQKLVFLGDTTQTDGIEYVLKECFPVSLGHHFCRKTNGEIIPCSNDSEDAVYLHRAQLLQMEESAVSQKIYRTSSRMLPIREASQSAVLTLPDQEPVFASNTVTVMDALTDKGRSLSEWIRECRRFTPAETFRILQHVLLALQEVHQAGYLHLDIQDGNIFLRGTLKNKSELITLIDFGCARALVNGETAPVQDRVIFTTPGFSAPEILLHNDGSLRLGPEADLYSVGCLALYLLTGQRPDYRMLLANRTGLYLKPNQLRRINCPSHLVGRIQQILARALEKEPEQRYHSAEEMLADVADMAEALQPYRTDLSCIKYDAFICYRHGPTDSVAALALQRALENYHAPKGTSTKHKPFSKVFVDEGELSSCSDFGQQIREALKNSGWLIVICSPGTPTSPWVQLEIETFLEYHDRSRILAVLTGGDETISFPPQLKATDGHSSEVFAADARADSLTAILKKLKNDALLRLAAPMLGTTFDTLKQRQKLYRMKRLAGFCAALLAATAGFAAYAVNRGNIIADQAVRIEQEYRNALINESRFLTEQAQKRLDHNDPIGAMELLLQALPSAEQDRPILTEAEYELGKALGIYKTPSSVKNTVTAEGIVDTTADCFLSDSNGDTLFLWDAQNDNLQAWDAHALDMLWSGNVPYVMYDTEPILYQDRALAFLTYEGVTSIDAASGADNWAVAIVDPISLSVSEDEKTILVISGDRGDHAEAGMENPADHILTATYICADTGETLQSSTFPMDGSQYICSNICVSADLRLAAVPTVDEGYDDFIFYNYNSLYLVDLQTGQNKLVLDSQTQIQAMAFLGDQLAVIRSSGYTRESLRTQYRMPYTYQLELYHTGTGGRIFSIESDGYLETGGIHCILETEYTADDRRLEGILFVYEDRCLLADRTQGTVIRQYTLPAPVLSLQLTEKGFTSIHTDGSISQAGFGTDTIMDRDCFGVDISAVCQINDVFFLQTAEEAAVYKYRMNRSDPSYTPLFTADDRFLKIEGSYLSGDSQRILLTGENRFALADLNMGQLQPLLVPGEHLSLLGFSEDGNRIYWSTTDWSDPAHWIGNSVFYCTDLQSGSTAELTQPECPWPYTSVTEVIFADASIYFIAERIQDGQCDLLLCRWDPVAGALETMHDYPLETTPEQWESCLYRSFQQEQDGKFTFGIANNLSNAPKKWVKIDPETSTYCEVVLNFVPEAGNEMYANLIPDCCMWSEDDSVIFAYGRSIYAADQQGDLMFCINAQDDIVSLKAVPDGDSFLLVLSSGNVIKYSTSTGEELSCLQLSEYCSEFYRFYYDDLYWQTIEPDTLLTVTDFGGFVLDVSGDTLVVQAVVDQCFAYDPVADRFLVGETEENSGELTSIGSFHRYQVGELIQMAENIINN